MVAVITISLCVRPSGVGHMCFLIASLEYAVAHKWWNRNTVLLILIILIIVKQVVVINPSAMKHICFLNYVNFALQANVSEGIFVKVYT